MAKIKLDIYDIALDDLLEYAEDVVTGCTGNAAYASVATKVTELGDAQYDLAMSQAAVKALEQQLKIAMEARDNLIQPFKTKFVALADACDGVAEGDGEILASGNWQIQADRESPQPLGQVQNLVITTGLDEGTVKSEINRLKNAVSYEAQWTLTPETSTSWAPCATSAPTKIKTVLSGMPAGALVFIRMRGIGGSTGHGPWSDPAMGRVG